MKIFHYSSIIILSILLYTCGSDDVSDVAKLQVPVYVTKAQNVPMYIDFVGQVYGYKDIAIRARVEGFLEGIHFQEGSRIEEGKLLYTIESQQFRADEAAKLSRLAEAKTMLAKAESDLNRYRPLAEQNAVSQSDLDAAVASYDASVSSVKAAQANLRASRIQLSYTKIYSPISGTIGKTQAKVGDFVGKNPNPVILNVVSRIDTILVDFFLSENQYLNVARYFSSQEYLERDLDDKAKLRLILSDGSLYKYPGKIDFIDRGIDPMMGAILVQASFPNPDELIKSGQYAKVQIELMSGENSILVPQRCLIELQGQYQVYVVDDSGKVESRQVQVGPKSNNFWLISEGLAENEQVIYEGLQKVRSGIIVEPIAEKVELITTQTDN
jgi:membrane fusion protein, multidrug efflux system